MTTPYHIFPLHIIRKRKYDIVMSAAGTSSRATVVLNIFHVRDFYTFCRSSAAEIVIPFLSARLFRTTASTAAKIRDIAVPHQIII